MKKILMSCLLLGIAAMSQAQEETRYFLPRTAINFTLLIEKSTYTPGEFSPYAERFLKKSFDNQAATTYRILTTRVSTEGKADPDKSFIAKTDTKRNIQSVSLANDGVLLAINTEPRKAQPQQPFIPSPKPTPLNPRDFMSQEILSAGNKAKMAELTAQEIYDIRESKNMLAKGQADYMPKDGEQLRLMIQQLNTQEAALLQMFQGTTVDDTIEQVITIVPTDSIDHQLLFRFSRHFGMVDNDDLSGEPYYLTVEDLHSMPSIQVGAEPGKKDKQGTAIHVMLPGRIRVTLSQGDRDIVSQEFYAAQYGRMQMLDENLFSKKLLTSIVLDPATGNLETIKTEALK